MACESETWPQLLWMLSHYYLMVTWICYFWGADKVRWKPDSIFLLENLNLYHQRRQVFRKSLCFKGWVDTQIRQDWRASNSKTCKQVINPTESSTVLGTLNFINRSLLEVDVVGKQGVFWRIPFQLFWFLRHPTGWRWTFRILILGNFNEHYNWIESVD